MPVLRNLITDVPGLLVGAAEDGRGASGVSVVLFEEPAVASVAIQGGAPGVRDTALLEPDMTVEKIDAIVLSGGSAYGLDAAGGAMNALLAMGRGFAIGSARVPIVPQAILFDLLNGGDKAWLNDPWERPPYWELGHEAARNAAATFALGTAGAGYGATTVNLKGGLGSASAEVPRSGHRVGALVAVNAVGSATVGETAHFWAAPYEIDSEFGGLGFPATVPATALAPRFKGLPAGANTNLAIVATDAVLTKAQAKRLAIGAHDGLARALRPVHAAMDGDVVFAAATGRKSGAVDALELTIITQAAADCLARAVGRAVFEARALPFANALPDWRGKFEGNSHPAQHI